MTCLYITGRSYWRVLKYLLSQIINREYQAPPPREHKCVLNHRGIRIGCFKLTDCGNQRAQQVIRDSCAVSLFPFYDPPFSLIKCMKTTDTIKGKYQPASNVTVDSSCLPFLSLGKRGGEPCPALVITCSCWVWSSSLTHTHCSPSLNIVRTELAPPPTQSNGEITLRD